MQFMIVTTINSPTDVFRIFSEELQIRCIAVGDVKTPANWKYPNVEYLSISSQEKLGYRIIRSLPYAHYSRKNIGYIFAKRRGASTIIDTDDDNFPDTTWKFPIDTSSSYVIPENSGYLNVYEFFSSYDSCWPRGFPLDEIISSKGRISSCGVVQDVYDAKVGIWQGLVNGDSDLDAIYRLTHENVTFDFSINLPVIMGKGCYCPINSQNTIFAKELFVLLYLPSTVSFRFTDILRGYIAQIIACHSGYKFGFTSANAFQARNVHKLMDDFEGEVPMYLNCKKVVERAEATVRDSDSIEDNIYNIYADLVKANIVSASELDALNAFLFDMTS
jgi:hypothetical protein